jgi:hypothetical protein
MKVSWIRRGLTGVEIQWMKNSRDEINRIKWNKNERSDIQRKKA